MSILQYFTDWKKTTAVKQVLTQVPNGSGGWVDTLTPGASYTGIKYSRSDAQRYFSQSWAADVQDILVIEDPGDLTRDDKMLIGTIMHAVDSIDNVGEQDEAWLVGLKVII